jgi:hypothetical protein
MAVPKKSSTGLIVFLVIAAVFLLCVGGAIFIGWAMFGAFRTVGPMVGCFASFQMARDAVVKYAKEHGETLPDAATWQDDVSPYLSLNKDMREMQDAPFDMKVIEPGKLWGCSVEGERMTGIAFNSELSRKKLIEIPEPYSTFLIFEIEEPRMNAAEPFKERDRASSPKLFGKPRGWIKMPVMGEGDFGDIEGNEFKMRGGR